jgi:hypothetical protein
MKERPILFKGPMVRAILEGRKTQTRRVLKLQWTADHLQETSPGSGVWNELNQHWHGEIHKQNVCPYGVPGDRLWVRETWNNPFDLAEYPQCKSPRSCVYRADYVGDDWPWKPSIHMPRWASRITLDIKSVRVERLQDISEEDAKAEGVEPLDSERDEHDWTICPKCGGTRLHSGFGENYGVIFDIDCVECDTHKKRFMHLWESINGHGSWELNPWVWKIEFREFNNEGEKP